MDLIVGAKRDMMAAVRQAEESTYPLQWNFPMVRRIAGRALIALGWLVLAGAMAWAAAALYFDFPFPYLQIPAVLAYVAVNIGLLALLHGWRRKSLGCLLAFLAVLGWWLSLSPGNDRHWQPDLDRTAWAEFDGDRVTIHNLRNVDYRTETDFTPNWESRTYDLAAIEGIDIFVTYWGSEWIAHPILSFRFKGGLPIAISAEARKEIGESYSSIAGFFRQYELIYVIADERDVIRLRTNYRTGEEVYLYRTTATPAVARGIFLDYLRRANALHEKPEFYNALTSNCTTNIRIHTLAENAALPWDWRLLLNGKADEYVFAQGRIAGDPPFDELKRRAHINAAARAVDQSPDFSQAIRLDRPGFDMP